MKKTLLVTIDFPPAVGGVATYWKNVCQSVPADKLVVLTAPTDQQEADGQFKCKVIRKPLFFQLLWPRWLKGIKQVYKTYRQEGCEQILVGQLLPIGSVAYLLKRFFKVSYSVQIYGMDLLMAKQHPRKYRLAQKILKSADKIFVNTRAIGTMVRHYTDQKLDSVVIYPVPPSVPVIDDALKSSLIENHNLRGKKIVLTVGRLVARKGQDTTLGAMLHVWQDNPDVVYAMVGDGPDRERLEEMAESNKHRVIFTGTVSDDERNAWLSLADVFVMPSRQTDDDVEGFGIVFLEANQFAKPVIGGKSGGVAEAVLHEKTGLLVDPEDVDVVARAIKKILNDPDYAKTLGENGKKRLEKELTWKDNINKFIEEL